MGIFRKLLAVHCRRCEFKLYTYRKGGKGQLVKCFVDSIVEDHTTLECKCPICGSVFCRPTRIRNRKSHKIIGGKVFTRGS